MTCSRIITSFTAGVIRIENAFFTGGGEPGVVMGGGVDVLKLLLLFEGEGEKRAAAAVDLVIAPSSCSLFFSSSC